MKRIQIFAGQHNLRSTNLSYLAEGVVEAIAATLVNAPAAAGNQYILKGVAVTATSTGVIITGGYVYYKASGEDYGQVYKVVAGNVSFGTPQSGDTRELVSLHIVNNEEDLNPVQYGDGTTNDVYQDQILELRADTSGAFLLSDLKWRADKAGAGVIVDWYSRPGLGLTDVVDADTGLGIGPMLGYAICDGRNDTPDQRGMWRVSYDERTVDPSNDIWDTLYSEIGNTMGEKAHLLTADESGLPEHNHVTGLPSVGGGSDISVFGGGTDNNLGGVNGGARSAVDAHENRPPSRVFATFQKI
jgi:hypothetical protein